MRVILGTSARTDLESILAGYAKRSAAAASKFLNQFELAKLQLEEWPRSGQIVELNVRRVLVPGFSFGVFYRITEAVVIVAILDLRRNPDSLNNRVLKR